MPVEMLQFSRGHVFLHLAAGVVLLHKSSTIAIAIVTGTPITVTMILLVLLSLLPCFLV